MPRFLLRALPLCAAVVSRLSRLRPVSGCSGWVTADRCTGCAGAVIDPTVVAPESVIGTAGNAGAGLCTTPRNGLVWTGPLFQISKPNSALSANIRQAAIGTQRVRRGGDGFFSVSTAGDFRAG